MKKLDLSDLKSNLTRHYKEKLHLAIKEKFPDKDNIELPDVTFREFSKTYKTARFNVDYFFVDGTKYETVIPESYSFSVDWLRELTSYEDVEKKVDCHIKIQIEFFDLVRLDKLRVERDETPLIQQ